MVHWASHSGPVPHRLHERHREPDEDSRQDQGEEDQQPGLGPGGSILKANMEVEAAVELAHDLDQTGMHWARLHRVGSLGSC